MTTHINRLKCAISNTPGTSGALTIAAAASGFRTFGASHDGMSVDCLLLDGTAWEVRTGCVYTHATTSLSRGTLEDSSTSADIDLTSATQVLVTASAAWGNYVDGLLAQLALLLPNQVGGVAVGAVGAVGGIYEGYTLSWGDDFTSLDILAPHLPRGKWFTTRTYAAGARGSDTLLGTMYDTDPYFTGHNDSNRGVPVGFANMSTSSSVLTLQARASTTPEQAHMSSARHEVASMVSGAGTVHWYPSVAGSGDVIIETRMQFSTANPAGWHPTFWLLSLNPVLSGDLDEIDWEANSANAYLNLNIHTDGVVTSYTAGSPYAHDGLFHNVSFVVNTTNVRIYIDGVLYATGAWNGNSKGKPQYPMLTSHVYNGTYNSEAYNASAWTADANGATLAVDWIRVWRRSGTSHFKPLVVLSDQNVDYGGSMSITLPSALVLWGDAGVTEYVQAIYAEENEPGVTHTTAYSQFPVGVSYNSGTRTLTTNITSGKTGRINFIVSAWKPDGSTGEPLRFAVNVGPVINLPAQAYTVGKVVSLDLYAACDCGVLTSNGTDKAKTIVVSGLDGSGLSYSDSTGLLTGTAVSGTYSMSLTVTNSVGQTASASIGVTVSGATAAYESWTGVGWFDASDAGTLTLSGSNVTSIANKRGGEALTRYGTAITYVTGAQNGKAVLRFPRDITQTIARLSPASGSASALSAAFQGDDHAYTVITVYKPTDTNTGFIWSASNTVDSTEAENIALVRRNASASSVRRAPTTAASTDVNWGSGQASGTARVVAVKHTGTTVSVWDNSITPSVNGAAQNYSAFSTQLTFYIGAAQSYGTPDPQYATTACAQDVFEILIEGTAKADADIQQAITDLADKWGITLV